MAPGRSARAEPLPAWDAVDDSAGATTRGRKRQCTSTTSSAAVAVPLLQQQSVHRSDDPAWFTSMLEDFHNENPTAIINANLQSTGSSLNTNEDLAGLNASTLPVMKHALAGHEIVTSSVQSEKRSTSVVGNNHGRFLLNNSARVIMDFDELSQDQLIELVGSLQLEYNDLQDADLINTLVSGVILKGTLFTNSTGKNTATLCHGLHSFQLDPTSTSSFSRFLTSPRINAKGSQSLQTRPRRPCRPCRSATQHLQPRRSPL